MTHPNVCPECGKGRLIHRGGWCEPAPRDARPAWVKRMDRNAKDFGAGR